MNVAELRNRLLPRGPLDLLVQLLVLAAAYTAWRYARGAVAGGMTESFENARDLISAERSLNALIEGDLQGWAQGNGFTAELARWGYEHFHFKGSVLALLVIYFGYRDSFGFVRNAVIGAMALSVAAYALYPTAPPRFIPELGLDGAASVTGNDPLLSDPGNPLFNPFAAVPSMHVGLSVIFAWSLAMLVPWRPLKALLFAYPLLMTYVVVASGNHFWLDAVFGLLVAVAAAGIAYALGRVNPDWAFRPRPARAVIGVEPEPEPEAAPA